MTDMGERGENEERMVRFGYFAQMAGARWDEGHTAELAALLRESKYDVQAVLREISAWCYGEGRDQAKHHDLLGGLCGNYDGPSDFGGNHPITPQEPK